MPIETSTNVDYEQNPIDTAKITIPGQLNVIRRNKTVTQYDENKIATAMTKAFLAVEGGHAAAAASTRIHEKVAILTKQISDAFMRRWDMRNIIHIEEIQDQVELVLMRSGEHKVARAYVLYREKQRKTRELAEQSQLQHAFVKSEIHVTLHDGAKKPLDEKYLATIVNEACTDLNDVNAQLIIDETLKNLFDGVKIGDVNKALLMSSRTLIEKEPNYSFVAARLLSYILRSEALSFLQIAENASYKEMCKLYPSYFKTFITRGVELKILDTQLLQFDLEKLGKAIKPERDLQFTYLGLQTLYDRYFIHHAGIRYELSQAFFMRVAMGLSIQEKAEEKNDRAIEFYLLLSSFDYMSSTPTLFNSGTVRPQLSSCYLSTVPDDLSDIFAAIKDNALLSKFAGGLGNDWTPVRALGADIVGTNGKSSGVVPFLKVANDTAVAVNQGGKRKGALCSYLETWHLDIEEFLELRKNTGDDRRRTHDMNTANWVPDLFMQRVFEEKDWTLFSPNEVLDLHDLYGDAFKTTYEAYELKAKEGEIKNYKTMPAINLWRKMLSMLFETGHPWITFKDACNLRSPQQHAGVIHSSNLCTEITLNTSKDEIAVCNLGSINLVSHLDAHGLNKEKLQKTISTAIRMLDNVIDINYYSVPQAKNSNFKHRPIGLGIMGFQDALYQLGISYASDTAVEFADQSMELISYLAIQASSDLAKERGSYKTFSGSLWDQGILPIDSIKLLKKSRGAYLEQNDKSQLDWEKLRQQIKKSGIRNSNVLAIAPTATISNICGVTQSIEPTYQNLFVKSNLSGEFTIVNPYLVAELKKLKLWDEVMVNDLKYFDGSVQRIDRIPADIKMRFKTAFELETKWLIEAGSRRQKWIDQAQSLNLYMAEPSGKKIDLLYRMAWLRGLKTTYYLRTLAATRTEKSTLNQGTLNAVQVNMGEQTVKACNINDPDCEACQ